MIFTVFSISCDGHVIIAKQWDSPEGQDLQLQPLQERRNDKDGGNVVILLAGIHYIAGVVLRQQYLLAEGTNKHSIIRINFSK